MVNDISYRSFHTDAVRKYAAEKGVSVDVAVSEILKMSCPLDCCTTRAPDARTLAPEERATEGKIVEALRWLPRPATP